MADKKKALDALNKLNNYSGLPVDHRWVSTVRHYIKEAGRTVRSKRPVQQTKHKITPMCCTCASRNTELNCGTCHGHSNYSPA